MVKRGRKVLVLYGYLLSPDRDAGSLRMYELLKLFKALSWQVTFAVGDLQSTPEQRRALQEVGVNLLEKAAVDSLEAHLKQQCGKYDLVIMSSLPVALKHLSCIRRHASTAKLVFDTTDLQHLREFRRARVTGEGGWLPIAMRSRKWELAAVKAVDCTWVVNPNELAILVEACPGANVQLLSLIQPLHCRSSDLSEREGILFIGSFPHHPNADAMHYFVGNIYPLLKAQMGDEPIYVIGPEPPEWLQRQPGLNVLGYVPDIAPYFERCKLSMAPLRYGAGVNGKVILSMSFGLPVVASTIAAEGLPVVNEEHILTADDPAAFCDAMGRLYHDERLWNKLSQNGLRVVQEHYSIEANQARLTGILEDLGLA